MNSKSQGLPMSFDPCGSIELILSTAPAYRAQRITIDKFRLGNSYPKLETYVKSGLSLGSLKSYFQEFFNLMYFAYHIDCSVKFSGMD